MDEVEEIEQIINESNWKLAIKKIDNLGKEFTDKRGILRCRLYLKQGKYDDTLKMVKRSLKFLDGRINELDRINLYLIKCQVYQELRRTEELEKELVDVEKKITNPNIPRNYEFQKVMVLFDILTAYHLMTIGKLIKAEKLLFNALQFSESKTKPNPIQSIHSRVLFNLGLLYRKKANYPVSIDYLEKSLKIDKQINDMQNYAKSLNNLALLIRRQGNHEKARQMYLEALKLNNKFQNKKEMSNNYLNLGMLESDRGDRSEALLNFSKSLELSKEIGHRLNVAGALNNIGNVYNHLGEFNKALGHFIEAAELTRNLDNKFNLALILGNIGMIYTIQIEFEKAISIFNEVEQIQLLFGNPELLATPYESLAYIHQQKGDYELSLNYYKKAIMIYDESNAYHTGSNVYLNMISIYLEIDELLYAKESLKAIGNLLENTNNKIIRHNFIISEILIEKYMSKSEYSKIVLDNYYSLLENEDFEFSNQTILIFCICELLLIKLQTNNDLRALKECRKLSVEIEKSARSELSFDTVFYAKLLQSKLSLLEFDLKGANREIVNIIEETNNRGLTTLNTKARHEFNLLKSGESEWLKLQSRNVSMQKRIEASDIIRFVKTKGGNRGASPYF